MLQLLQNQVELWVLERWLVMGQLSCDLEWGSWERVSELGWMEWGEDRRAGSLPGPRQGREPLTSWAPPFKQHRKRKMCVSDISLHLCRRVAFTFFIIFKRKHQKSWSNQLSSEETKNQSSGWQQRKKSQRVRYLSPNTNYVKFLKTCIINKWYCTNAFVFSSFSVGSPWDFSLTTPPPSAMLFLSSGCPGSE